MEHPILADQRRLIAYIAAWELLGLMLAALLVFGAGFHWPPAMATAMPLSAFYAFACLGAYWVCRAAPLRLSTLGRVASTQLAAATLSASIWLLASQAWTAGFEGLGAFPGLNLLQRRAAPLLFVMGFLLFLLAAALHYLLLALEDSRVAETEALRFQILSREAELRALRAQVHPHFLFNSLNSINALVVSQPEEARRMCVVLADFLRRSLDLGARDRVPLADELALAEDLLAIEKVRFGARLDFVPQVEEDALEVLVPPLLLQPLVENAVTHGIAQLLEGGTVRLDARRQAEKLVVSIENPRDSSAPARKGGGIGIENVRRRLDTLFGRDAELRLRPQGELFRVELELPAPPPKALA
jgi:hypothetical protein